MMIESKTAIFFGTVLIATSMIFVGNGFLLSPNVADNHVAVATVPQGTSLQTHFTVEKGKNSATFGLGEHVEKTILATSISIHRARPIRDYGSNATIGTFSPAITKKYVNRYGGTNNCPASFFNRYAEDVSLYAANSTVIKKLKNKTRGEYQQSDRWEYITVSGRCLTRLQTVIEKGEDVTEHVIARELKPYDKCLKIWVESIDIKPADLTKI